MVLAFSLAAIRIPVSGGVATGLALFGAALIVGWLFGFIVDKIAGGGAFVGSVAGTYLGAISGAVAFYSLGRIGLCAFIAYSNRIPAFIAFVVLCALGGALLGRRFGA